ncbi:unnamed protein product [Pieris brassicae]|uniref:Uncharacterized protein n=1 Tax=Pieris brassicae TaxID=7116 RepID=A0A9P0TJ69_PIEBR|nr:unnamed protein product [Pieris brassicae]
MCTGTHLHSTLPPPSECSGIDDILRMLDRDPGFSAASSPRTAFESDLIFLAQSAACSFASRGMLRAMARYAKSREETLRNSGMLESPLTEAEQRELALVRDECRFPARTPATPVRRPFSAVDPGSEGESAAKRPCAPSYAPGLPGEPRLAPGRRLDMGPSVLPPSETDPPSDTSPPSVTAPPPAAPLAGRAASAIAPSGATDATSFGPDDPVAPATMAATPAVAPPTSGVAPKGDEDVFTTVRRRTRRGGRKRRAPPSLAAQEASRAAAIHAVTTDVATRAAGATHPSQAAQATHAAQPTAPAPERAATAPPPPRTAPPPRSRTRSRARWPQMEEALSAVANILQAMQAGENPAPLFRRAASAFKGPTRGRSRR